jgi:hypothetical protein
LALGKKKVNLSANKRRLLGLGGAGVVGSIGPAIESVKLKEGSNLALLKSYHEE